MLIVPIQAMQKNKSECPPGVCVYTYTYVTFIHKMKSDCDSALYLLSQYFILCLGDLSYLPYSF